MILSFRDKRTGSVARGEYPKGFPAELVRGAQRKVAILNAARSLDDLKSPPGNRLHALSGDRRGYHAIRLNDQFRLYFRWAETRGGCCNHRLSLGISDMTRAIHPPVHPGEILREEYLAPLSMSAGRLAKHLHVPRTRIERLVAEASPVTPDTALRLGKFFATSPEFWMNLQTTFDLTSLAEAKRSQIEAIETMSTA